MANNISLYSDIEIYVVDPFSLEKVSIIDVYESLQWQPAYSEIGSFQLDCPIEYFEVLTLDYLIVITADKYHAGVIQYKTKTVDDEGAESITVKGSMLESMLNNRIIDGAYSYTDKEPTEIVEDLLNVTIINPADVKRRISNFIVGNLVKADEGVITYGVEYAKLGDEIVNILSDNNIGFRMYVDLTNKVYVFDTYKGINRTYQANTETTINTYPLSNYISNGDFTNGLNGWTQISNTYSDYENKYSLNVINSNENYIFQKEKLKEQYPVYATDSEGNIMVDNEGNPIIDHYEFEYLFSGYIQQSVSVNKDHIYYMRFSVSNPTSTVLGFGINNVEGYTLQAQKSDSFVTYSALYVPEDTSNKTFVVAYGDLSNEDQPSVQVDYALFVDLTDFFGVGKEPSLQECDSSFYYNNGWYFDQQIVSFIPNEVDVFVLSRDRDTLLDLDYTIDNENEVNFMYIKGSDQIVTIDNTETGILRKESIVDLSSSIPKETNGIVIPDASYKSMLLTSGKAELRKLQVNEIINGNLYLGSNKQFGKDFGLGDMFVCADTSLGFVTNQRITSVNQVWDSNGYSVDVTLGEDILSIIATMKLVKKGAL